MFNRPSEFGGTLHFCYFIILIFNISVNLNLTAPYVKLHIVIKMINNN